MVEQLENTNEAKLKLLVRKVIGGKWHLSPLTEIPVNSEDEYQEWDLHLDEIIDNCVVNHFHKRFTLFNFLHNTLDTQLIIILNVIKGNIEYKKSLENQKFGEKIKATS